MKLIERTHCPVCLSKDDIPLLIIPYKDEELKKFLNKYYSNRIPANLLFNYNYELVECGNCKFIFQKFIPDEKFSYELYENIISADESLKKKKENPNINFKYDMEIHLIEKIFKNKDIKILEFGAGWGFWSSRAVKKGYKVDAFELSKKRINYMKSMKINVVENLKEKNIQYDFIYSDQTLEHLTDPHQIFKQFLPNLKKDGFILLSFPSAFGFKKKLKKKYIPKDVVHPLEHINLFNRNSFNYLIKDYNLEIVNFKFSFNPSMRNFFRDLKNFFYFDNVLIKKN